MIHSYFDESHVDKGLVVAGFVAESGSWEHLAARWRGVLQRDGVRYFHAHDYVNGKSHIYRHLDRRQKIQHLDDLLSIIRENVLFGVGVLVSEEQYNKLTTRSFRSRHGGAYATAVWACVVDLIGPVLTSGGLRRESIAVTIESGHKNTRNAIERLELYQRKSMVVDVSDCDLVAGYNCQISDPSVQLLSIAEGGKFDSPPLQAADLLAYCFGKLVREPNARRWRDVARKIISKVPVYTAELDDNYIHQLVRKLDGMDAADRENQRSAHSIRRALSRRGIAFELRDGIIVCSVPVDQSLNDLLMELGTPRGPDS